MSNRIFKNLINILVVFLLLAGSALATNRVELSTGYFPNPDKSRALPFAQIFVGIIDLDPEILANQKQISVLQESGAETPVPQPLLTNAGGVPVYNGSPVSILVDGPYSLKVLDKGGSQVYYIPNTDAYVNNEDFVSGLQTKVTKIDTIADLRTHTGYTGESVQVLGYYTPGDGGGGPLRIWEEGAGPGFYVDNSGSIIVPSGGDGSAAWVWDYIGGIYPEWYGAVGDGITDDLDALNNWLQNENYLEDSGNTYSISEPLTPKTVDKVFTAYCNGMQINLDSASTFNADVLRFNVPAATVVPLFELQGIRVDANFKASSGIRISGEGEGSVINTLHIEACRAENFDNNAFTASVKGIMCDIQTSITKINYNTIFNLQRTTVSPGIVASQAIVVTDSDGSVRVIGNVINGVTSPSGDADADGIVVFSPNRLIIPSERQITDVVVARNRVVQCKGRWIKLQVSKARVHDNYLSNVGVELIDNFVGIDAQAGGVQIHDNIMRAGFSVGGASFAFMYLQARTSGAFENIYNVHDNQMFIEQDISFAIAATTQDGTNASIKIHDNTVKSVANNFLCSKFIKASVSENMDQYNLEIEGNTIPTGAGELLQLSPTSITEDPVKGPLFSDIFSLKITGNTNTTPNAGSDIINSASSGFPYLQNVVFADNNGYSRSSVGFQGCDVLLLPEGNRFAFGTDGGAGGLLNTPTVYNRFVEVEINSPNNVKLTKISGADFVVGRKSTGVFYEYTGVLIP